MQNNQLANAKAERKSTDIGIIGLPNELAERIK